MEGEMCIFGIRSSFTCESNNTPLIQAFWSVAFSWFIFNSIFKNTKPKNKKRYLRNLLMFVFEENKCSFCLMNQLRSPNFSSFLKENSWRMSVTPPQLYRMLWWMFQTVLLCTFLPKFSLCCSDKFSGTCKLDNLNAIRFACKAQAPIVPLQFVFWISSVQSIKILCKIPFPSVVTDKRVILHKHCSLSISTW